MKHYQIVKVKADSGFVDENSEEVVLLKDLDTNRYYSFVEEDDLRVDVDQEVIVQFQSDEVVA